MAPKTRFSFPPCPKPFQDHVYKVAHGVEVPLRVWPATSGEGKRPWMLWFHGGGFTFGKHYHPNPWVIPAFRERGYHVVSAAYRFLPHVSLWDVVDDSRDAYEWCKTYLEDALSKSCGEGIVTGVDIERYVVAGESVGGLLVTLAGHNFNPRPRAIAAIYPFTDPLDPYFHPEEGQPSGEFARVVRVEGHSDSPIPADPHAVAFLEQITPVFEARHRRGTASSSTSGTSTPGNNSTVSPLVAGFAALPLSGKHTPLELYEFLCQRDPRKASYAAAFRHELPPIMSPKSLREFWGTPEGWTPGETPYIHSDAMIFQYAARLMIRNGGRRELYGSDEEWRNALRNLSSQALVEHRARLTGGKLDYPPTYLIHGDADITVPAYHSEQMAAKLRRHGVVVVDKYISNAPHSFDLEISDPSHPGWKTHIVPCMDFVDEWVWADKPAGRLRAAEPSPPQAGKTRSGPDELVGVTMTKSRL